MKEKMKEKMKLYKFLKTIYSKLLKILYRPTAYGIENIPEQGPIIFVGNHRHAFDPIVVMTYTDRIVHYMAKESLFKGIHGKIFESIGLIKVHRNRTEQDLLPFRHGAVAIAKEVNSKIIPFAIRGKYRLFKKGLSIEFGKPVDVSQMEIEEANDYIKNEVLNIFRK